MGGYAEGELDEAARLRGEATDREIMRQAFEGLRAEIDEIKRGHHRNGSGNGRTWFDRYGATVNVILGVLLTLTLGGAFAAYKTSSDKLDQNTAKISELDASFKQLQSDRTSRIAKLDEWRESVETELRTYRVGLSDFRRLEGTVAQMEEALRRGREERLADKDKIVDAIGQLKTEVALLRQSVEARGRDPADRPFRENRIRIDPRFPFSLRASLTPAPNEAPILRVAERP